ncbi:MAG: peptide-N-glycosidase F-related protein [Myxococcota bacterium]
MSTFRALVLAALLALTLGCGAGDDAADGGGDAVGAADALADGGEAAGDGDAAGPDGEAADVADAVADVADAGGDAGGDAAPEIVEPPVLCADGLPARPFSYEQGGVYRHDLAGDFTFERTDGTTWRLSEHWTGCDTYVFIPDTLRRTQIDPTSIWAGGVPGLIAASPDNVHYVFISRAATDEAAAAAANALAGRFIDAVINMPAEKGGFWLAHLHVTPRRAGALGSWVQTVMDQGTGALGFAIDRTQRIRGLGSLSDVTRQNQAASAAGAWPFETNLAYASNEARYLNAEAAQVQALQAEEATRVVAWDGEVLAEFAETEVTLPSAAELAEFDTLHIEVEMRCPDAKKIEPGNCGEWDYLAHLYLLGAAEGDARIELGRFITAYARETRWASDVSPMLAHLKAGGTRKLRWDFAPPWNTQPTWTRLALRFSKRGKGMTPREAVPLYFGGNFGEGYNEGFAPIDVPIPADATRVELYSVITGHGSATSQCAEFCNHAHEFTVNGKTALRTHPTVGVPTGCMPELARGMVPNQYGTWWYGRGGWCPGQQVAPWIVDVSDVALPGTTASVSYRGLLNGAPPPPDAGNIVMSSWLVIYK